MWRGGFNPPGRFLVPVVAVLAVAVALVWERRGLTAGAALLVGWGALGRPRGRLAAAARPPRPRRDGPALPRALGRTGVDGAAARLRAVATPHRDGLAARLGGGAAPRRALAPERVSAGRLAVAGLGWIAAAQLAAWIAEPRTGDRDAVRLVGRPALAVPGWVPVAAAEGEWGTHRARAGALSTSPTVTPRGPPWAADSRSGPGPTSWTSWARSWARAPRGRGSTSSPTLPGRPDAGSSSNLARKGWGRTSRCSLANERSRSGCGGGGPLFLEQIRLRANPSRPDGSKEPGRSKARARGADPPERPRERAE